MTGALLAIDVPWLLYRSHFALPRSIRGAGDRPVGALLGTVNTILGLAEWSSPRVVVCCVGAEEAAYRIKLYPPYHAHREPMPAELREQWQRAPDFMRALGWTVAVTDTLEADDLLGSFARVEGAARGRTLICSADRDLYQTVDERTSVIELHRAPPHGTINAAGVRERSGVDPPQIPDLIALRGDPSDGIPGARGIGAKTAAELLRVHGTLEGVLAVAATLRPRVAQALVEQADELRHFLEVATLQQIEVERPPDRATDRAAGAAAARALGMNALATRLDSAT
jgi:DNA polymerase-1